MHKSIIIILFLLGASAFCAANPQTSVVPPCCLVATATSGTQINLTWRDMHNSETGFQIERSLTSGSGFAYIGTTAANVTSYSHTGLSPNTKYFYRIRAVGSADYSSYTSEASATTTNPPPAPSGLAATAMSYAQINLAWTDNSTNETGFQIERSLTSGSGFTLIATTAANATSYSHTGLTANTQYFYLVRTINAGGYSNYISASATTMPMLNPPSAPSGLAATAMSYAEINLAWTDKSTNESGFEIERSLTSGSGFTLIATTAANATWYRQALVLSVGHLK